MPNSFQHLFDLYCTIVVCFPLFALMQKVEQKDQGKPKCSAVLPCQRTNSHSALVFLCMLFIVFHFKAYITAFLGYHENRSAANY
jgi:hypothetical protein